MAYVKNGYLHCKQYLQLDETSPTYEILINVDKIRAIINPNNKVRIDTDMVSYQVIDSLDEIKEALNTLVIPEMLACDNCGTVPADKNSLLCFSCRFDDFLSKSREEKKEICEKNRVLYEKQKCEDRK